MFLLFVADLTDRRNWWPFGRFAVEKGDLIFALFDHALDCGLQLAQRVEIAKILLNQFNQWVRVHGRIISQFCFCTTKKSKKIYAASVIVVDSPGQG
jgi:hypothetical protein